MKSHLTELGFRAWDWSLRYYTVSYWPSLVEYLQLHCTAGSWLVISMLIKSHLELCSGAVFEKLWEISVDVDLPPDPIISNLK